MTQKTKAQASVIAVIIVLVLLIVIAAAIVLMYNPSEKTSTKKGTLLTQDNYEQAIIPFSSSEPDIDLDGITDELDNCPFHYNPYQEDTNHNNIGDACELRFLRVDRDDDDNDDNDDDEEEIECETNDDCDDNDSGTEDACINPGTEDSYCTNEPIEQPECITNVDCNDGLFCNGIETCANNECLAGTPPITADQIFCTVDLCSESLNQIFHTPNDDLCGENEFCSSTQGCLPVQQPECTINADCNDNLFCNGIETCANNECQAGTSPVIADQISCTLDSCSESLDKILHTPNNSLCEENETCSITQGCIPIEPPAECTTHSECNDNNNLTYDECINEECRHTEINCASDVNCGFEGLFGDLFCSSNVFLQQNYRQSECVNPGTPQSFCSIAIIPKTIEQCEFVCSEGACIRCDTNLDCNDNNSTTGDTCVNPGTIEAFCENNFIPTTFADVKIRVREVETLAAIDGAVVEFKVDGEIIATKTTNSQGVTAPVTIGVGKILYVNVYKEGYAIKTNANLGTVTTSGIRDIAISPLTLECTDSDGGIDYFTKGTILTTIPTTHSDYCVGDILNEYYCGKPDNEQSATDFKYKCPNGCSDGACIQ